jgi:hypothetical protein
MQKNMEKKMKIDQMSKDVGERKKNIMCLKKGKKRRWVRAPSPAFFDLSLWKMGPPHTPP